MAINTVARLSKLVPEWVCAHQGSMYLSRGQNQEHDTGAGAVSS